MKTVMQYLMPMTFEAEGTGTGTNDDAAAQEAARVAAEQEAATAAAAAAQAEAAAAEAAAAEAARAGETDAQKLLREVMEKKAKLKEANDRVAALEAQLSSFDGINVDEVRQLIADKRAAELASEEAKGNFENVKRMMAEEHERSTTALKSENQTLKDQIAALAKEIDDLTIGRDFSDSKFIGEDLVLPRPKARSIYGAHFERVDGRTVGYDKPAGAANRTMLVDATGNPLPFDEAFKRIIDSDPDKNDLLKVKVSPGSGSTTVKVPVVDKPADKGLFGVSRIAAGLANLNK